MVVTRSPQGDIDKFNDEIIEICEYFNSCSDAVYICGDFNLDLLHFRDNYKISTFLNIFASGEFIPVINKPTRWNITGCKTLIDNIFVNNSSSNLHSG